MIYELDDEPTLEEVKLAMDGMAWNTNLLIEEVMDKLIAKKWSKAPIWPDPHEFNSNQNHIIRVRE
jgi:hypothetical protein